MSPNTLNIEVYVYNGHFHVNGTINESHCSNEISKCFVYKTRNIFIKRIYKRSNVFASLYRLQYSRKFASLYTSA